MWNYTKCTAEDRDEKLKLLAEAFGREADCLDYLSEVQNYINSTLTTVVLLQDVEANIMIEMDYAPVNNYSFHVVRIEDSGLKKQEMACQTIGQAVSQFMWLADS